MRPLHLLLRSLLPLLFASGVPAQVPVRPLVERLGFAPGTKVLLVNADDAGLLHAINVGTIRALQAGIVGSATVMTLSPWFPEIATFARENPQMDFGVHLTFTSEWTGFRYAPILGAKAVPSLVDGEGYLLPTVRAFHERATLPDVEAEGRAQIRRALNAGLDVSHLDLHMHALGLDAQFFEVYLRLAQEFDLPVRFIPPSEEVRRAQATRLRHAGIIFQDLIIVGADQDPGESRQAYWRRKVHQLSPGVTELYIHVAADDPELHAMTGEDPFRTGWRERVEELRIFDTDAELQRVLDAEGVKLVRWKALRELQRRERGITPKR